MAALLWKINREAAATILTFAMAVAFERIFQTAEAVPCRMEETQIPGPPPFPECRLQYYVEVMIGEVSQSLLPPINESQTGPFGHANLFAFNATAGPQTAPTRIGSVRGFTLNSANRPSEMIDLIEVELISYDDGVYRGTIQIQGEIRSIPANEIAIVGGTGSFRGVRGYGFVQQVLLQDRYRRYHHDLHFIN
ncbi:hypothetical protein KP509_29G058300 [Ceratopteris richardii]|uniref:Dirigent protein n=1 Tax=Ceratopteris richardii TaxID=49495 RepID=A0A8T2R9N2_CERRI|nr:hypothetical protein KP509_29G058300 [Ceratopteris richardii]